MEWQLFDHAEPPAHASTDFYRQQGHSPHLEQEGHRQRLLTTAELVSNAAALGATSIVDLGAGDGGLLQAVRELGVDLPAWGYDLQPPNVAASVGRGVEVIHADFLTDDIDMGDIAVCSEVLEHLVDPRDLLQRIHKAGCRWLVASSPYTETPDAHYEFHLWAWDIDGYRTLLESHGWRVIDTRTAWICQIVLAERAS